MARGRAAGLAAVLCGVAAAVGVAVAGAAPQRSGQCEALARSTRPAGVCYGTLPVLRRRVVLTSRNGSHGHGVASITFGLHQTVVALTLNGEPKGVRWVAFLRLGGCWGTSAFRSLGVVGHGRRVTTFGTVPRVSGLSVVVRERAAAGPSTVVACGVIPRR